MVTLAPLGVANLEYVNRVYTENININLKNVDNVEKNNLTKKNKKPYV